MQQVGKYKNGLKFRRAHWKGKGPDLLESMVKMGLNRKVSTGNELMGKPI